jgi:hypothetical protein
MKAYGGSGGLALRLLTSELDGGEWLASRRSRCAPMDIACGTFSDRGPQSRSGRLGEEKHLLPLPESNPNSSVVQSIVRRYTD